MVRAGVFIGVDKSGDLQQLHDAAAGAKRMHDWALAQGMTDKSHARLIIDGPRKKVKPDQIYDAIDKLLSGAGIDQLIIYFAGHGVNNNRNEVWLLSDAPVNPNAAVNVSGSVEIARYGVVDQIVVISDACRVAPQGIQALNVRGVDIFPNPGGSEHAREVAQFFACGLGNTAAETTNPAVAAKNYSALYTNALLDALSGKQPSVLDVSATPGDSAQYVWPRKLADHLEAEIPKRVKSLNLQTTVNQNPDAIITFDATWVSRITGLAAPPPPPPPAAMVPPASPQREGGPRRRGGGAARGSRDTPTAAKLPTLKGVSERLASAAASGRVDAVNTQLDLAKLIDLPGTRGLIATVDDVAKPYGPDHFETQCGIKVRGARLVDFLLIHGRGELLGTAGDLLRIDSLNGKAASVLLRFEGNFGTVVAAIPEFLATVTVQDGDVVDVGYEPSANTWRWDLFQQRAVELRTLRAVAASSSQHGRFRLDQPDAAKIAKQMQYAKGIDPTLAVYAAYAYHDLRQMERIRDMAGYMRSDIGVALFDLELLGRRLVDKSVTANDAIVPFIPLLSQGWALLNANRVNLHPALEGIESTMRDSLWSLFDNAGLAKLSRALKSKEVR
ncbi:MAG: hypothetical protein H0T48_10520 [Gemmatimonadaceae bacterium]|nr:hypothetical protein [Gemmatimonadaceae bacterium]